MKGLAQQRALLLFPYLVSVTDFPSSAPTAVMVTCPVVEDLLMVYPVA